MARETGVVCEDRGALPLEHPARDVSLDPVHWAVSPGPVSYEQAVAVMEARAVAIAGGGAPELAWLLEHPPLYTAGTSATPADLVAPARFPVHSTGRGGRYTYHGPGQRVVYVMLRLDRWQRDIRCFVRDLELWLIDALANLGVQGAIRPGRVGVWVARPDLGDGREDKIAALGIRVRRGVSLHGISLNVVPDLEHFAGIVPCGIADQGVTSLAALGVTTDMADVDAALRRAFERRIAPTRDAGPVNL